MSTQTNLLPKYAFLISGSGKHKDRLQAFDTALLNAGPLAHNLVAVSSILPANCKIISPNKGFSLLSPGQITFCVMAKQDTNKPGDHASAAVSLIKSKDPKQIGYISEYHGSATSQAKASAIAQRLATEMYAQKTNTPIKKLKLEYTKVAAASIKQNKASRQWVCAVAICVFVL